MNALQAAMRGRLKQQQEAMGAKVPTRLTTDIASRLREHHHAPPAFGPADPNETTAITQRLRDAFAARFENRP